MADIFSSWACCFWWFLLGVLLGWLLNWLMSRCCRGSSNASTNTSSKSPDLGKGATASVPVANPTSIAKATVAAEKGGMQTVFDAKAAAAAGVKVKSLDDLQVIEGIGPKICGLLNADGIHTFEQLSRAPTAQLSGILERAGPRFKLANPATWPEQAALAAAGKWTEFKALTDSLSGGVRYEEDKA